jgi:hypothetical protein
MGTDEINKKQGFRDVPLTGGSCCCPVREYDEPTMSWCSGTARFGVGTATWWQQRCTLAAQAGEGSGTVHTEA